MFKVYKPTLKLVLVDIFIILANIVVIFTFLPLTSRNPFQKYLIPGALFVLVWVMISYLLKRYRSLKIQTFLRAVFRLFYITVISFIIFGGFILIQPASPYSQNVLITILVGVFVVEYLFLFAYYAYRYATQYDVPELHPDERISEFVVEPNSISEDAITERQKWITEFAGKKTFDYLDKQTELNSTRTVILTELDLDKLKSIKTYEYSTFIQLKKLNNLREINKMFAIVNDRLPDEGIIVCCYRSQSTTKQIIFRKYPRFIAFILYSGHFILHRLLPKFFLTKRLYYDFTEGKKRIFSKTEVLGRLNYCGFEVVKQAKIDNLNYVIAKRVRNSEPLVQRYYGALIKLKRCGKNGKVFTVYKFRTMHPYAEFLQQYIFQNNSLAEGGKFKKDIRVTTMGHIMRKYWLDELPMFFNLIKGDMKLIGVRPLSQHYFNLYTKELQDKRIQFKPGLLPPFYADMPKTLDEIQASEMKYLNECESKGLLITDTKYFFLILRNILFNKARSA